MRTYYVAIEDAESEMIRFESVRGEKVTIEKHEGLHLFVARIRPRGNFIVYHAVTGMQCAPYSDSNKQFAVGKAISALNSRRDDMHEIIEKRVKEGFVSPIAKEIWAHGEW